MSCPCTEEGCPCQSAKRHAACIELGVDLSNAIMLRTHSWQEAAEVMSMIIASVCMPTTGFRADRAFLLLSRINDRMREAASGNAITGTIAEIRAVAKGMKGEGSAA